jgi:diaminopimelate epimerase
MLGGEIAIEIGEGFLVTMTGAVTKVAEGTLSAEIFED